MSIVALTSRKVNERIYVNKSPGTVKNEFFFSPGCFLSMFRLIRDRLFYKHSGALSAPVDIAPEALVGCIHVHGLRQTTAGKVTKVFCKMILKL